MEEYFPPMGTDHQILDGREARPRAWFLVAGGTLAVLVTLVGVIGWWKQRTHAFAVPDELVTIDYTRTAAHTLQKEPRVPLASSWRDALRPGVFPRMVGGTVDGPTWALAPRWSRVPNGWTEGESFGLYQVIISPRAPGATIPLRLRDRAHWSLELDRVLVRGRIRAAQEPVAFALNKDVFMTSISAAPPTLPLLSGYDASYIAQNSVLDSALFHRLVIHNQGLAPWRQDIARFAWNAPTGTVSGWSLEARPASSSLVALLVTSSTVNRTTLLTDGSATLRRHSIPTSTTELLQFGTSTSAPLNTCLVPNFHPLFHLSGESLTHVWSQISPHGPSFFEIGELDGYLSACLTARVDVDK